MISLGRLSNRNYGCRQRPIYLIFSQFSIGPILLPKCVCLRGSASDPTGGLPAPPAGKRWVSPLQRAPQNCGPQGPETPQSATGSHGLRRPSRDPMTRVIGTTGRGGTAAVRCQEYDMLLTVQTFTNCWDPIQVLTTRLVGCVELCICFELPSPSLCMETESTSQQDHITVIHKRS